MTTTDFEVEPLTVEIYNLEGKRVLNSKYQENLFVGNLQINATGGGTKIYIPKVEK